MFHACGRTDIHDEPNSRFSNFAKAPKDVKGKGKGKVHPTTGHEGPNGEYRCTSTISLTSALDWGGCSTSRPGRFTPGKDPVPIV